MIESIRKFLQSHRIMTLASCENQKPWVCTVYYADDESGNLYFVTGKSTKHATQILNNSQVAISIFDSTQLVTDDKEGLQATGSCKKLVDLNEIKIALTMWQKRNPGAEKHVNLEYVTGDKSKSAMYSIKLDYVKHMSNNYGDKDYKEWINE